MRMTPSFFLKSACIGCIGGIAVGLLSVNDGAIDLEDFFVWFLVAVAVLFVILRRWGVPMAEGGMIGVFAILIGVGIVGARAPGESSIARLIANNTQEYHIEGVIRDVDVGERQSLTLDSLTVDGVAQTDRIQVFVGAIPRYSVGNRVELTCELVAPEPFDGFRYDLYLQGKRIFAQCFRPSSIRVTDHGTWSIARLRYAVIDGSKQLLGEPHSALLAGLLIGEKRFSDIWEEWFVATGTSHIVAASGYNVTILATITFSALIAIGLYRQTSALLVMGAIFAFVIISGGDPPVLRAGIMGAIVVFSKFLGRSGSVTNILLLTATVMLTISPTMLFYDVGFQLSFLSTIGLVYLSSSVEKYTVFFPKVLALRESVTSTVSATLATLPIVLSQFGIFSLASLPVNLLILPAVPYAMAGGAISLVLHWIFEPLGLALGSLSIAPTWLLLQYMLTVIRSVAELPVTIVTDLEPIIQTVLWTLLLIWLHRATRVVSE